MIRTILCVLLVALGASGNAQTVESVLRALQERKQMLSIREVVGQEIQIEKQAALAGVLPDYNSVTMPPSSFLIKWPNNIPDFPKDDEPINNLKHVLAALNHASLVFDEIKSEYVAYDVARKQFVNTTYEAARSMANGGAFFPSLPEVSPGPSSHYAVTQVSGLLLPSIGEFTEENWRSKLKLLASGISQLQALPWSVSALRAENHSEMYIRRDIYNLKKDYLTNVPFITHPEPPYGGQSTLGHPKWKDYTAFSLDWLNTPGPFPFVYNPGLVDDDYYGGDSPAIRQVGDTETLGGNSNSVELRFDAIQYGFPSPSDSEFGMRSGQQLTAFGHNSFSWVAMAGYTKAELNSISELPPPGVYTAAGGTIFMDIRGDVGLSSRVWPASTIVKGKLPASANKLSGKILLNSSGSVSRTGDYTEHLKQEDNTRIPLGTFASVLEMTDDFTAGKPALFQNLGLSAQKWVPDEEDPFTGQFVALPYYSCSSAIEEMRTMLKLPEVPELEWVDIPVAIQNKFQLSLVPPPFVTKILQIKDTPFPVHRGLYHWSYHEGPWYSGLPWDEESEVYADPFDLYLKSVMSGGVYNADSFVVCVPNFTKITPEKYKDESLAPYAIAAVETDVSLDPVKIHVGRGQSDLNQTAWLGSKPDGFGSPVFHGSPNEFEIIYETDRAQFDTPFGDVKSFDSAVAELTQTQITQSGWRDLFAYLAGWHSPRLRQIKGGDVLVDIQYTTAYDKNIRFYWAVDSGNKNGKFYQPGGDPFKIVRLQNPTEQGGLPTEKGHLRVSEIGGQFHEITLTETRNPSTYKLSQEVLTLMSGPAINSDLRKTVATINYGQTTGAPTTVTTTTTIDGVLSTGSYTYEQGYSPRETDNPVLTLSTVSTSGADAETRTMTMDWAKPEANAPKRKRSDYWLKSIAYTGSPTWELNGANLSFTDRGLPKEFTRKVGTKDLKISWTLFGSISNSSYYLNNQSYYGVYREGAGGSSVYRNAGGVDTIEYYRDANGEGTTPGNSGSPWSLEKTEGPGDYQTIFTPTWSAGALTYKVKEGWGSTQQYGSETTTQLNRFGGLVSSETKVTGTGTTSIVAAKLTADTHTKFGAPTKVTDLRGRTTDLTYEETGANFGLPKIVHPDGLPAMGVSTYDPMGRPTLIKSGYEDFTPAYPTALHTTLTSTANAAHVMEDERFPSGKPKRAKSTLGLAPEMNWNAAGGGTLTIEGVDQSFEGNSSGILSKIPGGLGSRGVEMEYGVEQGNLYTKSTVLKKEDNTPSGMWEKTVYDGQGRIIKISSPGATGGIVNESWLYNDEACFVMHSIEYPPSVGARPTQTVMTLLNPARDTVIVRVDGQEKMTVKRTVAAGEIVEVTEMKDDSLVGGPAWVQVSKKVVNPLTEKVSFTPFNLQANTVTFEQSLKDNEGKVKQTVTNGLTGESLVSSFQNGLLNEISGKSGGLTISDTSFQYNAGRLVGTEAKVGGVQVGMQIGDDQRISQATGPDGTTDYWYFRSEDGFWMGADTTNGGQQFSSTFAEDRAGDSTFTDVAGEVPALSLSTTDTPTGFMSSQSVPNELGSLEIQRNLHGHPVLKTYNSGDLEEQLSYFPDGSVASKGIVGSGDVVGMASSWLNPYKRRTGYTDNSEVIEEFFEIGLRKDVEETGKEIPDGRAFKYDRMALKTETHRDAIWGGVTVTFNQDAQGRLGEIDIQGAGLDRQFAYEYDASSRLLNSRTEGAGGAAYTSAITSRRPEDGQAVTTQTGPVISTRSYNNTTGLFSGIQNALGDGASIDFTSIQRDDKLRITGRNANVARGTWSGLSYDSRGQLQSGDAGADSTYYYAHNGRGTRTGQPNLAALGFNALDQVTQRSLSSRGYGVMGRVSSTEGVTMQGKPVGSSDWINLSLDSETGYFHGFWSVAPSYLSGQPFVATIPVRAVKKDETGALLGASETEVFTTVPAASESFAHDPFGRLKQDSLWNYGWDAKDRLLKMTRRTALPETGMTALVVNYAYDADGRRVQKEVVKTFADGQEVEKSQLLWAGWLPVLEKRTLIPRSGPSSTSKRWFQWGEDRSGTVGGAGGIGGLRAIHEEAANGSKRTLVPVDDGLGNIVAVIGPDGSRVATYSYGPFGEWLGGYGELDVCPFRWQTKLYDAESELYYFGYRYYNPRLGRWASRDPLGEAGGFNLYGYCGNDPINKWDYLGLEEKRELTEEEAIGKKYKAKLKSLVKKYKGKKLIEESERVIQEWLKEADYARKGMNVMGSDTSEALAQKEVRTDEVVKTTFAAAKGVVNFMAGINPVTGVPKGLKAGIYGKDLWGERTSRWDALDALPALGWGMKSYRSAVNLWDDFAWAGRYADDSLAVTGRSGLTGAAGGDWGAINEVIGGAVRQQQRKWCGHATAQMLLADRGIEVSQKALTGYYGRGYTAVDNLDIGLNPYLPGWRSGLNFFDGVDMRGMFSIFNDRGSWGAAMKGSKGVDHWVVVDGISAAGNVLVRDPWNGSAYEMVVEDFFAYWTEFSTVHFP